MFTKNVLVVDDDPDFREMISRTLIEHGLSVTQAENGQEALEKVDQIMPALIILDMNMPVMDGWEFAKHFYRRPDIAPVIVLTAEKNASQNASQIGAKYALGKPLDKTKLLNMVDTLTAGRN